VTCETPLLDATLDELRGRFPRLRVVDKRDDGFSRLLDLLVRIVTFGGNSAYMTRYVTTLGQSIYLPTGWSERSDLERVVVLRHEAVHLEQFRRYGKLGMAALYLFPVFPIGLALGRARLEWEAYAETFRATAELLGLEAAEDPGLREHVLTQFVGPAYGYMWPFRRQVARWIDAELERIRRGLAQASRRSR
jgi:hypothetical protein